MFQDLDCSLVEINPLVVTGDGDVHCLDAKVNIDNNALYRQPAVAALRDPTQEDEREAQADEFGLNYVALDGNIGCMVNGAGLAMGTMDLVKLHGGNPANFLDVGGGATEEAVAEAFKIILSDDAVKAVLINIFGGIVSCKVIAEGIIAAVRQVGVEVPVIVRFEGNNAAAWTRRPLRESGLAIATAVVTWMTPLPRWLQPPEVVDEHPGRPRHQGHLPRDSRAPRVLCTANRPSPTAHSLSAV